MGKLTRIKKICARKIIRNKLKEVIAAVELVFIISFIALLLNLFFFKLDFPTFRFFFDYTESRPRYNNYAHFLFLLIIDD